MFKRVKIQKIINRTRIGSRIYQRYTIPIPTLYQVYVLHLYSPIRHLVIKRSKKRFVIS